MTKREIPYAVELAIFYRGEFSGWNPPVICPSRLAAWEFIKSQGYDASHKNDRWIAYPA